MKKMNLSDKKKNRRMIRYGVLLLFFVVVLFLVEKYSNTVALYNHGYGTFDMKTYHYSTVKKVLSTMSEQGFHDSYIYYALDTVFLLLYAVISFLISKFVCNMKYQKTEFDEKVYLLLLFLICARAIFDLTENAMFVFVLSNYPIQNKGIIDVVSVVTQLKLHCIQLWNLFILIEIAKKFLIKPKKQS